MVQRRSYKDLIPVLLCILILGVVGFYVAINTVTPPSTLAPAPPVAPPVEVAPPVAPPAPAPALTAPNLVTPHNGATGIELRPRFLWKAVPNAKGYELAVSLTSDFSDTVIDVSMGDTAYQLPPDLRYYQILEYDTLAPSTRYYWIVVAKPADPNTPVAYSGVWTFTTALAPEALVAPPPVSVVVNLAPYSELKEFHNPKYLAATEGCVHASAALALAEGQVVKLTLESDCPISWDDFVSWENPRSEIGVIFAEMRSLSEPEGWCTICSGAKEVKHVSSYDGGRRFEIVLTPADIAGCGFEPPGTGIYKLLAVNLDPDSFHHLGYSISSLPPPTPEPLLPLRDSIIEIEEEAPLYFDWEDVEDPGVTYTLQIAADINFTSLVLEKEGLTESEYTLTEQERKTLVPIEGEEAAYYWQVKAIDNTSNQSEWSGTGLGECWSFTMSHR